MSEDERTMLIAQSIIFAGLMIARSASGYADETQENTEAAQRITHSLAQNLDSGIGYP